MKQCTGCLETKPLSEFGTKGIKGDPTRKNTRCKACVNAYYKAYYRDPERYGRHKERIRKNRHPGQKYGLSREELIEFRTRNGGMCELCNIRKANAIDHDHDTGKLRGSLCTRCNVALGAFGDNIEGLQVAMDYLKNPPYGREA